MFWAIILPTLGGLAISEATEACDIKLGWQGSCRKSAASSLSAPGIRTLKVLNVAPLLALIVRVMYSIPKAQNGPKAFYNRVFKPKSLKI